MAQERLEAARRKSIEDTLESYRQTVLGHNMSNLRVIVEGLESREPAKDDMDQLGDSILHMDVACPTSLPRLAACSNPKHVPS